MFCSIRVFEHSIMVGLVLGDFNHKYICQLLVYHGYSLITEHAQTHVHTNMKLINVYDLLFSKLGTVLYLGKLQSHHKMR